MPLCRALFFSGFRIRIFSADPDPGKNLHADPDPDPGGIRGRGLGGKGKKYFFFSFDPIGVFNISKNHKKSLKITKKEKKLS